MAFASGDGRLLARWLAHAALGASAGTCFGAEVRIARRGGEVVPCMHAAWHVLSALALLTVQPFVLRADQRAAACA